jgi:hypothetical protein
MIQSPVGMPRANARTVSVWAMGKKITNTQKENRMI